MFHLYNLPKETEWPCTFNERRMYGAVGVNTNFSHANCMGRT